ncbi:MAG TPA: LysM domain-containing protein, partial [Phycicoccus elongatus]|nr:LysM domain-containing protein [Phycicoccus elongatus]
RGDRAAKAGVCRGAEHAAYPSDGRCRPYGPRRHLPPVQAAAAAEETYTVQPGDTLGEIGARFGVDYHEIARVNGIENPDLIYPGQVFTIPR